MNEQLKLAKEQTRQVKVQANADMVKAIISNPVLELALGLYIIAWLNRGTGSVWEKVSGLDVAAGTQTGALVGIIGLQQLAPYAPAIIQGGAEGLKSLTQLAPLLLTKGAMR